MAPEVLMQSKLWQRAFNTQGDANDKHRSRLQNSLLSFRERVGNLLTFIPSDMRYYTVHDLTHLDALWEMADLIAGDSFTLNPAETYVFGGAVLLHDAGMTLAAYPDGMKAFQNNSEWDDSLTWAKSVLNGNSNSQQEEAEAIRLAVTDMLRRNHASKAEELATQKWVSCVDGAHEFLIEDSELRTHFGRAIGKIAHSHHWSVRRVISEFQSPLGSLGDLPVEWTINYAKVAFLLRCADAAHLDHRRAPKLLFTLTKPVGIAKIHWTFQSKIAKPQAIDGKLMFTSRTPFLLEDVNAWHLCWDVIKMVDNELSDSCDALRDMRLAPFAISGVFGAKSAESLAKHISVEGWRPIPTELQVSDVPHLARTLGGRDLYSLNIAPLRELLQNAADAIDARVALDCDFQARDAKITVKVVKEDNFYVLSVEDDGLGMSEKTLTGALLDFGTSFWKSDAARNEFPGLKTKFVPRGRYGIGFFSVFMWADLVKVSSRKFSDGVSNAKVLEFRLGLGSRPILRPANSDEVSSKYNTKVTLKITEERWLELFKPSRPLELNQVSPRTVLRTRSMITSRNSPDDERTLAVLTAMLRIGVYLADEVSTRMVNFPDWDTASSEQFTSYMEKISARNFDDAVKRFAKSDSLVTKNGETIGRAFLTPNFINSKSFLYYYEKGIFVQHSSGNDFFQHSSGNDGVVGLVEGKALNAARDRAETFNISEDNVWLEKQIDYMNRLTAHVGESIACQESLIKHGTFSRKLPLFLLNRSVLSLEQLLQEAIKRPRLVLTFSTNESRHSNDDFGTDSVSSSNPFIGKEVDEDRIYFLTGLGSRISAKNLESEIEAGNGILARILYEIKKQMEPVQMTSNVYKNEEHSRTQNLLIEFCKSS